jgi:hypothetical protein
VNVANTMEEAITARLKGYAGLNTAVGGRVFPQLTAQDSDLPCVVYQRQGSETPLVLGGAAKRLTKHFVRVDGYARTEAEIHAVGVEIVNAMHNWSNSGAGIQGVFHTDSEAGVAETPEGGSRFVAHTFAVWFKPAA